MSDAAAWHDVHASQFAARYRHSPAFRERERLWSAWIARFSPPDARVLDAGCGPGVFSRLAAAHAGAVLGFDPSPAMLALAREAGKGIAHLRFAEGRIGEDAVIGHDRFDLVLCSSVLEYLDDWEAGLSWLAGTLRPGGVLLFSLPNGQSLYRHAETLAFTLSKRPRYLACSKPAPAPAEVEAALRTHHLTILDTALFGRAPVLSAFARRAGLARYADTLRLFACRKA